MYPIVFKCAETHRKKGIRIGRVSSLLQTRVKTNKYHNSSFPPLSSMRICMVLKTLLPIWLMYSILRMGSRPISPAYSCNQKCQKKKMILLFQLDDFQQGSGSYFQSAWNTHQVIFQKNYYHKDYHNGKKYPLSSKKVKFFFNVSFCGYKCNFKVLDIATVYFISWLL